MKLGIDLGSQNIHCVILNGEEIAQSKTVPHNGNIFSELENLLSGIHKQFGQDALECFGITGSLDIRNLSLIDPVLATVQANKFFATRYRNILAIGCESFYLVRLDAGFNYLEHSLNSDCASGTGSFIDQQAKRLGYSTEIFAEHAKNFTGKTPTIATRCSVFAKSDIIHSQAEGFSTDAIAAGICEGVVRSILSNVLGGRRLEGDLLLIGGVSRNKKIVTELEKALGVRTVVSNTSQTFNALGAALLGEERDFSRLRSVQDMGSRRESREKLKIQLTRYPDFRQDKAFMQDGVEVTQYNGLTAERFDACLGIDVGSTSTKCILVDQDKNILLGLYTSTAGDPVAAVAKMLRVLTGVFKDKTLKISGAAVTGSGRKLIKEIVGADMAINEITAHAKGATFLDPEVDTIIEIGGQDSKFTILKEGFVASSVMNYVCAAGTGSFIEEQAKKLNIPLDKISELALGQEAPLTSSRCTVYMERDLNIYLAEGWTKEQIMASVLFSVRDNYLSKVAGRTLLGNKVYFQGATARNKALVAAFENEVGKPIFVSKYCHLTGALGAAIILTERGTTSSTFRGTELNTHTDSEICDLCANRCNLQVFTVNGAKIAWGLKCGRDYEEKKSKAVNPLSRLEKQYAAHFESFPAKGNNGLTVGIPRTLYMKEYASLFYDFFSTLGVQVILEDNSAAKMQQGKDISCADFCSPILIMHGLVQSLMQKNVDYIFLPALVNTQRSADKDSAEENFLQKDRDNYLCYYSEYAPTLVNNLNTLDLKHKLISPKIRFHNCPIENAAESIARSLENILSATKQSIKEAFISSYARHQERDRQWQKQGEQMLQTGQDAIKILLLGRPYVVFDSKINSGIPAKLEALGHELMHQSMLDSTHGTNAFSSDYMDRMHWHYGQQILTAAETAIKQKNIYPVFLTNFRCSPDSYVVTYFKEMMEKAGKPYLIIQLDEHCSDVGYQTRLEAGVESFLNDFHKKAHPVSGGQGNPGTSLPGEKFQYESVITKDDVIYFPYLSPVLDEIFFAAFEAHGYTAKVLPVNQDIINLGYKYVSGGECLPNVAVVGSIIALFQKGQLDLKKSVLYLGDSCIACNFHQYTSLIRAAAQKAGIKGLRIHSPKLGLPNEALPKALLLDMTAVSVLGSLLYKLYFRFHPYEKEKGATQKALNQAILLIKEKLKNKTPLWEIPLQKLGGQLSEFYFRHIIKQEDGLSHPRQQNRAAESILLARIKELLHPSKHMLLAAREIRTLFENIPVAGDRKPRVGLLGDLYIKYNPVLNEDLYALIEDLGAEILIPSYMETGSHLMDAAARESGGDRTELIKLTMYEKSFEKVFEGILDDSFEPPIDESVELMCSYGIKHYIPGETTINVCRLLYYMKYKLVDAVIHVNPILCCPGSVTSSIYRKMQQDFNIPIVDLFYDGMNKPNKIIVPQISSLKERRMTP